jgi:hypothetical protein
VQCEVWSRPIEVASLKCRVIEIPELRCQSGKRRTTEVDWTKTRVIEVNLTLSVMAVSRGFEKFMYYRGFRSIEGRTTGVLLYMSYQLKYFTEIILHVILMAKN